MIMKWKVFNFKSVKKETELEFAPLTIFSGPNSSGKSTFLQSILLVAQTLAHKVSSRSVVLNGALARLGQFDDIRSSDSGADQITIGWTCQPLQEKLKRHAFGFRKGALFSTRRQHSLSSVSCEIAFDTVGSGAQKEITQIQPLLFSSQLTAITRNPEEGDRPFSMTIRRTNTTSDISKQKWMDACGNDEPLARASLQYDVEIDEDSLADIHDELVSAEPVGCLLRHFLPERLLLGVDMIAEDAQFIFSALCRNDPQGIARRYYSDRKIIIPTPVVDFILDLARDISDDVWKALSDELQLGPDLFGSTEISLNHFQKAIRRINPRFRREIQQRILEEDHLDSLVKDSIQKEREQEAAVISFRPPDVIAEASFYLDHFFSKTLRYLGPLRDEPKSLYPLAPTADPFDVGLKGEHTAAVFELHKGRTISYIPSSSFTEAEIKTKPTNRSLETAVIDWLQYMGVAKSVQSRDKGKFGHELTVDVSGNSVPYDLTHVGVGVSQVLPILVASLLAEPDTTLVFEQPELHLHPKVQTLLADFFLSMTVLGKQCIVESHSEYLINRLRFRTAAAVKNNPWVSVMKVYFVEQSEEGSTFREVKINEYGAVLDWPEGFFDQSQQEAEAILGAAAKKRKKKRNE